MRRSLVFGVLTMAVMLAACGGDGEPVQVASGDGWVHLGWFEDADGVETTFGDVDLFVESDDLDGLSSPAAADAARQIDFETQSVLFFYNDGGGCGPAVHNDFQFDGGDVHVEVMFNEGPENGGCLDFELSGASLFAIDRELLAPRGETVTIVFDSSRPPGEVTVEHS